MELKTTLFALLAVIIWHLRSVAIALLEESETGTFKRTRWTWLYEMIKDIKGRIRPKTKSDDGGKSDG